MKTLASLLLSVALISATATSASAYSFSPPDAAIRLTGTLTFTHSEGSGQPFTCKVVLDLKTKSNEIKAVKFPDGDCEGVSFVGLPWNVGISNANSGQFGQVIFESNEGNCIETVNQFQDNASGVWTLPAGGCLSGTLKSTPPVTIVP